MGNNTKIFYAFLLLSTFSINCFSQNTSDNINAGIISAIFKIEDHLKRVENNINRYENNIQKCDKTIATSTNIINTARQNGNTEAEKVANDALTKSTNARQKNIALISSAKLQKKQYETILASLKNEVKLSTLNTNKTSATLLGYSGNITIKKNNGNVIKLDDTNTSLLEVGDIISTSFNSKIDLQFLEGRGNLVLGENSKLKFSNDDSTDVIDMIEGKVKMDVKKFEAFYDDLEKKYEDYKKNSPTIDRSLELFYGKIRAKVKKYSKKFEVRTPSAVTSVRGTEFVTNTYDNTTEIIVIEGSVVMKSNIDQKTILVMTGQKGVVNNDGILSEPQVIDLEKLESWWSDEE